MPCRFCCRAAKSAICFSVISRALIFTLLMRCRYAFIWPCALSVAATARCCFAERRRASLRHEHQRRMPLQRTRRPLLPLLTYAVKIARYMLDFHLILLLVIFRRQMPSLRCLFSVCAIAFFTLPPVISSPAAFAICCHTRACCCY